MSKQGPGAQPLPNHKNKTTTYATPPTLAGKKGVASMGVPVPQDKDLSKRSLVKKISESPEKRISNHINTSTMSKSLFDKLFENVMDESEDSFGPSHDTMSDEAALGIEDHEGGDLGEEGGGDEVTLTLDRATAEKLHAALGTLLGDMEEGEEGEEGGFGSGEEEFGGDEGEEQDEQGAFGEGIEIVAEPKELKNDGSSMQKGKPDAITGSKVKSQGGKAEHGSIPEVQANPKAHSGKGESLQKHGSQKVGSFKSKGTLFDL